MVLAWLPGNAQTISNCVKTLVKGHYKSFRLLKQLVTERSTIKYSLSIIQTWFRNNWNDFVFNWNFEDRGNCKKVNSKSFITTSVYYMLRFDFGLTVVLALVIWKTIAENILICLPQGFLITSYMHIGALLNYCSCWHGSLSLGN